MQRNIMMQNVTNSSMLSHSVHEHAARFIGFIIGNNLYQLDKNVSGT